MPQITVFATIAAAVVCWAAGEVRRSRGWWTAGAILALIHSVAAFAVFYHWSHETARLATTAQTAAATGIEFGGGIYINYLFLVLWLADVTWWWASPGSYVARPWILTAAIHGFIFFIVVNGAVIFADGLARAVGITATAVVVIGWTARKQRRLSHADSTELHSRRSSLR